MSFDELMNVLITTSNSKWSLHQDIIEIGYCIVIFTIQKNVMRLRRKAGIILAKPTFCQLNVVSFGFANQWLYLRESKFHDIQTFQINDSGWNSSNGHLLSKKTIPLDFSQLSFVTTQWRSLCFQSYLSVIHSVQRRGGLPVQGFSPGPPLCRTLGPFQRHSNLFTIKQDCQKAGGWHSTEITFLFSVDFKVL